MFEIFGIVLLILSVISGGLIVVFLQNSQQKNIIKLLLALSGGFLISLTFLHLLPEIYLHHGVNIGYYVLCGFLLQLFLEYFSGGVEHGHVHKHNHLGKIPWGLFISLSIHAFIEGIPLEAEFHQVMLESGEEAVSHAHHHHHHHHHGEREVRGLLLGVILHNIPIGIALMTMMVANSFNKVKAWLVLLAFAIMGPLGVLFGHFYAGQLDINLDIVLAIVVGMFLHISTTIIFESAENHKFNLIKLISIIFGVLLAVLVIQF